MVVGGAEGWDYAGELENWVEGEEFAAEVLRGCSVF